MPETIRETAVPRTAECEKGAADRADYRSRWSDCQNPKLVDGEVADENAFPPGQGYLPKLVTKMNEMPTTFESSVVK